MTTPAFLPALVAPDPYWALLVITAVVLLLAAWSSLRRAPRPFVSRAACVAAALYLLCTVAFGTPFPFGPLAPTAMPSARATQAPPPR